MIPEVAILDIFKDIECVEEELAPYKANVTEYLEPSILGLLKPKDVEELKFVVKTAHQHKLSIYPYSSGKNWGLGSKLPLTNNSILLDLSGLKRIEVNPEMGYAKIQAGVTQQELSDYLDENFPHLKFPVTGSGKATAVVGNMLDRGATAFFHRRTRLLGLEVVLANGEYLQTGMAHFSNSRNENTVYAPGLGPNLTELFSQSNLGIVTVARIKLLPKQSGTLIFAETQERHIVKLINQLKKMKDQGILGEGLLVTNKNDPRTTENQVYQYAGTWSVIACISGMEKVRRILKEEAQAQLEAYCDHLNFVESDSTQALAHPYQEVLRDMYNGIPSDYSLKTMAALHGIKLESDAEVDQNKDFPGMAVALFAVPIRGEIAFEIVDQMRRLSEEMGVQPFYNFATLDDETFEGFFRVYFDRNDPKAVEQAHRWNAEIHKLMEQELGVYPYRLNIEQMAAFVNRKDDTFWQVIRQIKDQLDPHQIISKGRYCPV
jgi:4-cresol dehydrogenase (hydroxylating)